MLTKLTLFLTVLLALHTFARPSPRPMGPDSFASIQVRRRTLTRDDGVFDFEKARISSMITKNKHRQNKINIERNVADLKLYHN
ncbi:hypothetical protein APHAL10511_000519 [Amanita phalloides]|nr:hypothetical protein APHAL10511_000519 [Amanita phalloides]